jgi:hypothetical protein
VTWEPEQDPFPHLIIDGHWDESLLTNVIADFPPPTDARWKRYRNQNEGKYEGPSVMWGPKTHTLFSQIEGLTGVLSDAFKIPDLVMETIGGGYHLIPPGGRLNMHTDFNRSPDTGLYRRLNFLVFLNHKWRESDGGQLQLGEDDNPACKSIAPEFNRTVVFETSDRSWHGHPVPNLRWRFSVAAYFFSPDPPPGYVGEHSTRWLHDA